MGKKDRHMSRVVHTSVGTVRQVSIKFVETEGGKKRWS